MHILTNLWKHPLTTLGALLLVLVEALQQAGYSLPVTRDEWTKVLGAAVLLLISKDPGHQPPKTEEEK